MSFVKYRLKEVASDLGITPKEVSEIISKFFEKPKSNTQVLTDEELMLNSMLDRIRFFDAPRPRSVGGMLIVR